MIPFCSSRSPTVRDYGRWTTSDVGRLHFCMPSRHTRASNAARSLFQLARHYLRVLEFVEPPRTDRPTDRPTASNVKVRSRWLLSFCYSNGPGSHTCTTDYTTLARYVRTHTVCILDGFTNSGTSTGEGSQPVCCPAGLHPPTFPSQSQTLCIKVLTGIEKSDNFRAYSPASNRVVLTVRVRT